MGVGGSVWVHIEGIRRWTVDLEVDVPNYGEHISNMCSAMDSRFWDSSEKNNVQQWSENMWIRDMELGYQKA